LAECYGNGSLGLQIDHEKAFSYYLQASKQSHPPSTYRAAVCYEHGAGTKKDFQRAGKEINRLLLLLLLFFFF